MCTIRVASASKLSNHRTVVHQHALLQKSSLSKGFVVLATDVRLLTNLPQDKLLQIFRFWAIALSVMLHTRVFPPKGGPAGPPCSLVPSTGLNATVSFGTLRLQMVALVRNLRRIYPPSARHLSYR